MNATLLVGDVRTRLSELPDESVQCVVTSPPYWGLRDYKIEPSEWPAHELFIAPRFPSIAIPATVCCLGLEAEPNAYLAHCVQVFRELRRVLRKDGTLWLNMGDSYAGSRAGPQGFGTSTLLGSRHNRDEANYAPRNRRGKDCDPKRGAAAEGQPYRAVTSSRRRDNAEIPRSDYAVAGLKPKDLAMMPALLALARGAAPMAGCRRTENRSGRSANPMPESVRDRCTKRPMNSLFLLAKLGKRTTDRDAIAEACSLDTHPRRPRLGKRPMGGIRRVEMALMAPFTAKAARMVLSGIGVSCPAIRAHKGTTAYEEGAVEHRAKAGLVAIRAAAP